MKWRLMAALAMLLPSAAALAQPVNLAPGEAREPRKLLHRDHAVLDAAPLGHGAACRNLRARANSRSLSRKAASIAGTRSATASLVP